MLRELLPAKPKPRQELKAVAPGTTGGAPKPEGTQAPDADEQDLESAIGFFDEAISRDPGLVEAYRNRAVAYLLRTQNKKSKTL